jgi:hypothetical protein
MIDAIVVINVMYHLSFKYHTSHQTHSTLTPNGIKIKCQGGVIKDSYTPRPKMGGPNFQGKGKQWSVDQLLNNTHHNHNTTTTSKKMLDF